MNAPDPDSLSELLQTWQVRPVVPRDFQAQVWHRIAAREQEESSSSWRAWLRQLNAWAAKPAFAVAAVALSILLGAELGLARTEKERVQAWKELEERYHESINPVTQHLVVAATQ